MTDQTGHVEPSVYAKLHANRWAHINEARRARYYQVASVNAWRAGFICGLEVVAGLAIVIGAIAFHWFV